MAKAGAGTKARKADVAKTDVRARLRAALAEKETDLPGVLALLEEEVDKSSRKLSAKDRREIWTQELDQIPQDRLDEMRAVMRDYIENRFNQVNPAESVELTQEEIDSLAAEFDSWRKIDDLLQARYTQFRRLVFNHLNEVFTDEVDKAKLITDTPVEQLKGSVESAAYGWKFCREGGNRSDPQINWDYLQNELSPEQWEAICDEVKVKRVVVPAHVDLVPSEEKMLDAINSGALDLDVLEQALIPGSWQSPRFTPRAIG